MKRVYFIKPIGMDGPIKIGCSKSPTGRLEGLRTWCPLPLELLASIEGGPAIERRFHAMFLDDHEGHEWFRASARLTKVIASVAAGTFDIETLPAPVMLRRKRGKAKNPPLTPAAKLINKLGGTTAVARLLSAPVTTVQHWKISGIPQAHIKHLERAGVNVDQRKAA
tara:strand:- start:1078 stop:1578 length:501 start_codon:yes stop_codon:yes gene_type:complete